MGPLCNKVPWCNKVGHQFVTFGIPYYNLSVLSKLDIGYVTVKENKIDNLSLYGDK